MKIVIFVLFFRHLSFYFLFALLFNSMWHLQHLLLFHWQAIQPLVRTSQVSLSSNPDADFRYSTIYTQIGIYKGRIFAIKKVRKKSVDITREMKKELKMVSLLFMLCIRGFILLEYSSFLYHLISDGSSFMSSNILPSAFHVLKPSSDPICPIIILQPSEPGC